MDCQTEELQCFFTKMYLNKVTVKKKSKNRFLVFTNKIHPLVLFINGKNLELYNNAFLRHSYRESGMKTVFDFSKTSITKTTPEASWSIEELVNFKKTEKIILKKDFFNGRVFFDVLFFKNDLEEEFSHLVISKPNTDVAVWKFYILKNRIEDFFNSPISHDLWSEIKQEMERFGNVISLLD